MSSLFDNKKKYSENVPTQPHDFKRRLCTQTQLLYIVEKCYVSLLYLFKRFIISQMNHKEFVHTTAYSVQLPYIAGHSLQGILHNLTLGSKHFKSFRSSLQSHLLWVTL